VSKKGENSHVHHHVEAEQGDRLGERAGSHHRHAEAFPERAVHARERLVQALQGLADAFTALDAAHASVKDGVAALRASETKVLPLIREYTSFLRATFSNATAQLGDFGLLAPKARQPLSTEKRAAATAKMRATRTARGTTSKKQKLGVKGDVTGVVVTPITAPGPSSPTTAPAGPAPIVTAPGGTTK